MSRRFAIECAIYAFVPFATTLASVDAGPSWQQWLLALAAGAVGLKAKLSPAGPDR